MRPEKAEALDVAYEHVRNAPVMVVPKFLPAMSGERAFPEKPGGPG